MTGGKKYKIFETLPEALEFIRERDNVHIVGYSLDYLPASKNGGEGWKLKIKVIDNFNMSHPVKFYEFRE